MIFAKSKEGETKTHRLDVGGWSGGVMVKGWCDGGGGDRGSHIGMAKATTLGLLWWYG